MLIDIINQDAEAKLLSFIESHQETVSWGALHFRFSELFFNPPEEQVLFAMRLALEDRQAAVYFFHNGDIMVTWRGAQKFVFEQLCLRLEKEFDLTPNKSIYAYYDIQAQGEELRLVCKKLQALIPKDADGSVQKKAQDARNDASALTATTEQMALFRAAAYERFYRRKPSIMVVEDQPFSSNLLLMLLKPTYITYKAMNAEEAWGLYLEHAPDICFLDIEMPGISGHQLAAALHKVDPQAFLVMVTGNHYAEDVSRALDNGAKGFIVKPFNRQKIHESIEKYTLMRKMEKRKGA